MIIRFVFFLLLLCFSYANVADELTIGIGGFYSKVPHYLGSSQYESYAVPLPYIYYEKDQLKVERNQFDQYFNLKNEHYLTLSAAGSIAVKSEKNKARTGMNDLDWTFELGPAYQYYFIGTPFKDNYFYVSPFIRKAVATDFKSVTDAGWRYGLMFETKHLLQQQRDFSLSLTTRATINYGNAQFNHYFYGVDPKFITSERRAYQAQSGYAGSGVSVGLSYDSDKFWLGGFIKYYYLNDMVNTMSPLFQKEQNLAFGIGGAWKFYSNIY